MYVKEVTVVFVKRVLCASCSSSDLATLSRYFSFLVLSFVILHQRCALEETFRSKFGLLFTMHDHPGEKKERKRRKLRKKTVKFSSICFCPYVCRHIIIIAVLCFSFSSFWNRFQPVTWPKGNSKYSIPVNPEMLFTDEKKNKENAKKKEEKKNPEAGL